MPVGDNLHNLAHISGKTDRTFVKFLPEMHLWTRKSQLNFGSHLDPKFGF